MPPRDRRPRFEPRDIDPEGAERALTRAAERGVDLGLPAVRDLVARVGAAAPAVLPSLLSIDGLAARLAREFTEHGVIRAARVPMPDRVHEEALDTVRSRLRRMRHEALARTALRELYALVDVDRTSREWSHVAAMCTEHAVRTALDHLTVRQGPPHDERGTHVPFVVLGMGKLGGEELNLGSDIDIAYFYGTDDGAAGEHTLNEHFGRVGTLAASLLEEATAEGFAFRVDLRLRPEGSRGPVANALSSAERYYETWGRSWERAALVRARPIAGDLAFGGTLLEALRPFVYRRSVDPRIAVDMASMLERTRREQLQHDARDLKIGTGGIREAEFFVQSLQLVWGGRHPALRVANTLTAVSRLRALGLLSHRESRTFSDAWGLLRRVEHRVQVMAAYETHLLPEVPARQIALARSLGYPTYEALRLHLVRARQSVQGLFASLAPRDLGTLARAITDEATLADRVAAASGPTDELLTLARGTLGVRDPESAVDDLLRLARRADLPFGSVGRERHPDLAPRLLAEVRDAPDPDRALHGLADLFGRLHAAERYAQRLADSPDVARGLVGLFGASDPLSQSLIARPDLLDAVVAIGAGAPTPEEIDRSVHDAANAARERDADDPESVVAALRRAQREITLRIGLADIAGMLTAGEVARRLSALAEACVRDAFALAARETAARHGVREGSATPLDGIAVFALGSLAARELGYGGDVDLIVLHAGEGDTTGGRREAVSFAEAVARIAHRAILFLSSPHPEGSGYAVDTRLRPSGAQGTLVVSVDAFARYHAGGGAAPWERQALIRTLPMAGDDAVAESARKVMAHAAYEAGPPSNAELLRLRERMERELGREEDGTLALKYGRGGIVDVEFATQALQMAHGHDPRVRTPTTRHALAALRDGGYLAADVVEEVLTAEKLLRRTLLATRLATSGSTLVPGTPAATTVARKLGYRDRGDRTAEEGLLADLAHERDRLRQWFVEVLGAAPAG